MRRYAVDRRLFLGASAVTLLGAAGAARAQAPQAAKAGEAAAGTKPTARVADFIAGFELKHAPALAIERARTAFIDTVGVMLAGSRSEPAGIVLELVRAEGAKPAVSIVGQSLRASPQLAALANGVASHALDFDFTYMQGQLVAPIIPALLPLAESTGATPAQTLAAFIVGFEVASRLSRANPNHNGGGAWHGTGTIGTIGAAAACARLLKPAGRDHSRRAGHQRVDGRGRQRQLRHHDQAAACGAGGTQRDSGGAARRARLHRQPGGDRRPRRVRAHFRARAGMAARRVRRSRHVIRSGRARISAQALSVRRRDPHRHRRRAQAARGAWAARGRHLRHQGGHLEIRRQSRQRAVSASTEAAKFNLQYVVAYALANGPPTLSAFGEAAIKDARVKALARMVSVAIDPEFADAHEDYPTRLAVTLADGRTLEQLWVYASGTRQYPMSPAQIEDKFLDCAAQAIAPDAAKRILATLRALGEQDSFAEFWPLLRRG